MWVKLSKKGKNQWNLDINLMELLIHTKNGSIVLSLEKLNYFQIGEKLRN